MKILITSDCYKPIINGVVTSIINLKSGLESLGHEVRILTLSQTSKSYHENDVYYIGSLDIGKFYPGIRVKLSSSKQVVKEIIEWKPDIVHTQSEFSTFTIAKKIAKSLSIPIVHTYHTMYEDYTHYFSPNKTMGKKAVVTLTNYVGNRVSAIIAPTSKIETLLNNYQTTCPIHILPSGLCLEKFDSVVDEEKIAVMKKELGISDNQLIMLSVSRVAKEKNIDELIEYMGRLQKENIVLVIVGDGPAKIELEALVKRESLSGCVKFAGMVSPNNVPLYYKMADLFVSASTSETQGLTYIEALASGTPILCREDDCLNQVLIEGENGYSFTTQDEFFLKLADFIHNTKRQNFSHCAKQSVICYSKEEFAKNAESIYQTYIGDKQNPLYKERKSVAYAKTVRSCIKGLSATAIIAAIYAYSQGYFTSVEELQMLIASVGIYAPLLFVFSQVMQVIIPVFPGAVGCLTGVLLFGGVWGFIYNYIGIVVGSLIVFGISKLFGKNLVDRAFSKSITQKYFEYVEKGNKFRVCFISAIFLPGVPDYLLCYVAGTTKMKWREYIAIILLGKPLPIAAYSLGAIML